MEIQRKHISFFAALAREVIKPPPGMVLEQIPAGMCAECNQCGKELDAGTMVYIAEDDNEDLVLCKVCGVSTNGIALVNQILKRI